MSSTITKAKHTPAPWTLGSATVTRHDYPEPYDTETVSVMGANGASIASLYGGHQRAPFIGIDEYRSNARLIAAAPALLDASKRLVEWIAATAPDADGSARDAIRAMRDAIAKAEQGSQVLTPGAQ